MQIHSAWLWVPVALVKVGGVRGLRLKVSLGAHIPFPPKQW
jgi:hypothetical protein